MAISIVQTADTDGAGGESSDTVTLVTPTTGNWLILYVGSAPNSTVGVASVSGGGVTTWTKAVAQAASTVADAEIWYGTVGSSPTTTVTVTYNSTQLSVRIGLIEASGVAGLDVTGSGTPTTDASGNASTPSTTPAYANDLFFAVAADGGPNINAIASPWTAVVGGGGRAGYGGYYLPGDSAAHSATFTGNASQLFAVAIAAFYPGASNLTVTAQTAVLPVVPPVGQASTPYAAGQTPVLPPISAAATVTVTFTATAQTAVLPLVGVAATAVVTLPATVVPYTTDGYAYLQRTRTFRAVATVTPAVASAPSGVTLADFGVPQVSETYNQPTIIAGLPYADSSKNPWLPASTNRQTWAKQLQIVVGGQDVTFFRNAPVTGITWSSQEPFADATATFTLPAVTTYDSLPVAASLPTGEVVGIATSNTGSGYWQASAEGLVSAYGDAATLGDPLGLLNEPVSGIAAHPSQSGYVLCAQDGGVFAFNVGFHGNALGVNTSPVIGIAMTSTGNGYWLLEENGTIHNYGDAAAYGPASVGYPTNKATGIARSGGGSGVVVVASNGGVFCFGDATFHGNGIDCYQAEYVGVATHPGTDGYLLVNAVGSAYAFGVPYKGGVPSSVKLAQPVNSVAMTTTGDGYWMSAGDGGVFTYGDAKFYGSIPGGGINVFGSLSWLRTGAPVTINRIDSSGNPHTLWEGVVLSWEDNTSTGNVGLQVQCAGCLFQADWLIAKPVVNMPFIGFNPETNLPVFGWDIGTAIAQAFNSAHNPSAGTALGSGPQPAPVGSAFNFNHCTPVQTGILTVSRGNWDKLATGYIQNMLAQAQNLSGFQWTVGIKRPRTPVIQTKNLLTTNWTVSAGARGVSYQLSYDQSTAATAIYGQGQAPPVLVAPGTGQALTGSWANSRYPQAYPSAVPAFPLATGHSFAPGDGQTGLRAFTDWMRQSGYPLISQDTYLATNQSQTIFDQYLIERFQQDAGLQVTGNIDSATWSSAFATGNNQAAVSSVFYAPLWQLKQVEPYTYSPSGAVTGTNPFFNPKVPRVERFEEMGQQITKAQGTISAQIEGERIQQPAWIGTVTLTCDPQEGSRFDIQAGQNIMLRWFRNKDTLFHISQVSVDFSAMTVQLTVTSQAADLQTLVSMWARDAQTHGVARVARPSLVTLNMSSNVTVFDAESGAGSVWPTSLTAGVWVVQRVPFSESGAIAAANFTSSPSTPFAVGVFSGPVAPSQLEAVFGSAGPLTADPSGNNPWNDFAVTGSDGGPGLDFYGMLYGAGGPNGACGYWPSDPNGLQTLTGRYFDGQTWPYASAPGYYPWVWVALWAQSSCTINGRFLMAPMPTS